MKKKDAKAQIDFWWEIYEQGHITAEQRDSYIEGVAMVYKYRRNYSHYNVLSK